MTISNRGRSSIPSCKRHASWDKKIWECNSYISIQEPALEKPHSKSRKNNGENPMEEKKYGEKPFVASRPEKMMDIPGMATSIVTKTQLRLLENDILR